jgi:hypothetical protein
MSTMYDDALRCGYVRRTVGMRTRKCGEVDWGLGLGFAHGVDASIHRGGAMTVISHSPGMSSSLFPRSFNVTVASGRVVPG